MDSVKYVILGFHNILFGPTTGHWFITPKFTEIVDMHKIDISEFNKQASIAQPILFRKIATLEEEYLLFFEFYDTILRNLDYPGYDRKLIQDLAIDFAFKSTKYTIYDGVKEELENISKKYKIILLSDNWPCIRRILAENNMLNYFDKIYISSSYGCKKEEGIIFDYIIDDYDISNGDAIFIDDQEKVLDIANLKGLDTRFMNRNNTSLPSKHQVINNLNQVLISKENNNMI